MAKNGVIASATTAETSARLLFERQEDVETLFTRLMELANLKTECRYNPGTYSDRASNSDRSSLKMETSQNILKLCRKACGAV